MSRASVPGDTLRVGVNVAFDGSVTKAARALAEKEAAAIWKEHDVELQFGEGDNAAIHLDVFVARNDPSPAVQRPPILGQTAMEGVTRGSIHISLDRVESTLERRHAILLWLYDWDLARALGRVLAHEIGHALLGGPPYHDTTGLMRANFPADDLANPDPHLFRLASASAARLRVRNAALLNEQGRPGRAESLSTDGSCPDQ